MKASQQEPHPDRREPPVTQRSAQRGARLFLIERALGQGMISLFDGAFFDGFALALGATTFHIGLLSAARFLGGFGQILTEPLLLKAGSRKRYCLLMMGLSRLVRLGIILAPYGAAIHLTGEPVLWWLFVIRLIMSTASSSAGIVLLGWMTEVVPRERRGAFLSARNLVMGLTKLPLAFLASWFLDRWRDPVTREVPLPAFQWVFLLGLALGVISLFVLARVPQSGEVREQPREPFWQRVRHPLQNPGFRPFLLFRLAWTFSVGFASSFFNVYMLRFLGLPYLWITVASMVGEGTSLLTARTWGRWIDRFGARPVLVLATLLKGIFPLFWVLVMPDWWWLIFLPMLFNVANSATQTATLHLSLHLPPPQEREGFMAVERSLTHPVRALSPLLAGLLARSLEGWQVTVGPLHFESLHLLFLISGVLRLSAAGLLLFVREPGSRSCRELIRRALRMRRVVG